MDSKEFNQFLDELKMYLEHEKVFIQNPFRLKEVNRAQEIIGILFPDAERAIDKYPLPIGSIVLSADADDLVVRGKEELALFAELTSLVDNFEVYAKGNGIHFAAVMHEVFVRLKGNK